MPPLPCQPRPGVRHQSVGERQEHVRCERPSGAIASRRPTASQRAGATSPITATRPLQWTTDREPDDTRGNFGGVPIRQLFPAPPIVDDVDLTVAYLPDTANRLDRRPSGDPARPWITVNMVASVDGSMTVNGRSGGMSNEGDRRIFNVLRSMADTIVVGAGTARAERYGPARIPGDLAASRARRDQDPLPRIAVVSRSGVFDDDLPLFNPDLIGDGPVPLIITCTDGEANVQRLGSRAEAMVTGDTDVDLARAMTMLAERGIGVVVSEGGPMLNASMVQLGLLDELCLTVSPLTVAGTAGRIISGPSELATPIPMELAHLLEMDGALYTRWRFTHPTT